MTGGKAVVFVGPLVTGGTMRAVGEILINGVPMTVGGLAVTVNA